MRTRAASASEENKRMASLHAGACARPLARDEHGSSVRYVPQNVRYGPQLDGAGAA